MLLLQIETGEECCRVMQGVASVAVRCDELRRVAVGD